MIVPAAVLGFVVLSTVVWGCKTGAQTASKHPLASLSLLTDPVLPLSSQTAGGVAIAVLCAAAAFVFLRYAGRRVIRTYCIASVVLCMLANGISGYVCISGEASRILAADAREALALTGGHDYIYVKSVDGLTDGGIDVNTKRSTDVVLTNDLINHLYAENGVYVPFVPEESRGFIPGRLTADTDTLVLDNTAMPLIKLSPYASAAKANGRENLYVVRFTPGERLVDSTVGNVKNRILSSDEPGILILYDRSYLQGRLTVRFDIQSAADQTLKLFSTREMHTMDLKKGRAWYEVTFDAPEAAYNFTVEKGVKFYGYELVR